jgi:predicted nucleic-acid-binding Zn-ribbon protein
MFMVKGDGAAIRLVTCTSTNLVEVKLLNKAPDLNKYLYLNNKLNQLIKICKNNGYNELRLANISTSVIITSVCVFDTFIYNQGLSTGYATLVLWLNYEIKLDKTIGKTTYCLLITDN